MAGCLKSLMTIASACVATDTRTQMPPINKNNLLKRKQCTEK
jgi:hypothetical protein